MNKKQDVDWEAVHWHKLSDSQVGRLVGRSKTQVSRVRRARGFPASPGNQYPVAVADEKPTAKELHASKTRFRSNPDVVVREEKHSSAVCYVIYVDGEVLVNAIGNPILFKSITSVRDKKISILENAKNGEKALTSTCWTLTKGSNASEYAKRLRL